MVPKYSMVLEYESQHLPEQNHPDFVGIPAPWSIWGWFGEIIPRYPHGKFVHMKSPLFAKSAPFGNGTVW